MINQTRRETVIKLLDSATENINLEDLFLFDLSPYYKEKLNDTFFSKQIEYQKDRDELKHSEKKISFASEQKEIYEQILDDTNDKLIISAPTSFGKTMLIKEYIYNEQPDSVVFVVPTNSLADELIDDFANIYTELGYTIYDTVKEDKAIQTKSIFIGTQEKFYQIYQGRNMSIDLFVIDEAYKLGDELNGSREVILNRTFVDTLNKAKRTILLLPLVNSIDGASHLNFKILKSDYSPVAKNFIKKDTSDFNSFITEKIIENKDSNLVYFNSPIEVEKFYLKYCNKLNGNSELSLKWIKRVEDDFHPEWIPIKSIKNGIGIHYGPMPKFIQKKVVNLFKTHEVNTILSTSSIIEGVNTPTKNIFITTSQNILQSKQVIKFKNLIGRAGRLGIHKVGNVYFKEMHSDSFDKVNIPYTDINLKFIIDKETPTIDINRESEVKSFNSDNIEPEEGRSFEMNREKTMDSINNSSLGNVPFEVISQMLNKHGFTVNQLKQLLDYTKKGSISVFGLLGKLRASDGSISSINVIIDKKYNSISEILIVLNMHKDFKGKSDSELVSIIIKMIYNVIPHKVIPALDFILGLNDVYLKYNGKNLFSRTNIKEANTKRALFYNKFLGNNTNQPEESKKIMVKLFEFGIPYFRAKDFLNEIASNVPENFSINDIKKIIFSNKSMEDLRIYFE
jgi:superfamily II helicase